MTFYYAVAKGLNVGIYNTWDECKRQVSNYNGAVYKKFKSHSEAETFIRGNGSTILGQLGITDVNVSYSKRSIPGIQKNTIPEMFSKCLPDPNTADISVQSVSIICFGDGSCLHNGRKNATAGYSAVFPNHPEYTIAKTLPSGLNCLPTNNRAEYMALIIALEACSVIDPGYGKSMMYFTDSKLLMNTATRWIKQWKEKGWRKADGEKVLNLDLVMKIDTMLCKRKVIFKHVLAHTGGDDWHSIWNDKADKLAKDAAQGNEYIGSHPTCPKV
jgi:ribonuclease HI